MVNLWNAGNTPYVTPDQLSSGQWPTGVDFSSLPAGTNVTQPQKTAALASICASATTQCDGYTNNILRAVLDTEQISGPDYRVTMQNNGLGNARVILSRWPVTNIVSVSVSPNTFPLQFTAVPANFWRIEHPVISLYGTNVPSGAGGGGQSILVGGNFASWCLGRNGFLLQIVYVTCWPHTSLTATATPGSPQTIAVDDCTGWAPFTTGANGASGVIYDGANQEPVHCTAASATSGPGTLTLASQLQYTHAAGVMVSAMPSNMIWAAALYAGADALTRGATSTTVRAIPGGAGAASGADALRMQADLLLHPYKRTI